MWRSRGGDFNVPNTKVTSPTVDIILAVIVADPDPPQMGPYGPGDANIKPLRIRRICPIPNSYGVLWIIDRKGMTWVPFFTDVYPTIVG